MKLVKSLDELWDRLMPQDMNKRMREYFPAAFLVIGAAIGMVLMTLLFYFFEETIKAWGGFSPLAFFLLAVYFSIAWYLVRIYRRNLKKALE